MGFQIGRQYSRNASFIPPIKLNEAVDIFEDNAAE